MSDKQTSQQSISSITRKNIFRIFQEADWTGAQPSWSGDLDEISFLHRLYMLNALPSTDSRYDDAEGDIHQHRINNHDWEDDWVFSDERFDLRHCSDEMFLRFLAETLHPEVRGGPNEAERLAQKINMHLVRDSWELAPVQTVSGYPIYGGQRHREVSNPTSSGFPLDLDSAIASVAEVLKQRGHARELAVLASSAFQAEVVAYDNWNGGTTGWGITAALDASLYARLTDDEIVECEDIILDVTRKLFRPMDNDALERFVLTPSSDASRDWQTEANRWLSGEGINNQGRVRSDNIASLECDGLLFRSEPEINLYRALKQAGVTFAPLPVFLRGGESYARLEPDFVILRDGIVLVVELDGDTYHRESPVDAHKRLLPLDHEGAKVERLTAAECVNPEKARESAAKLIKLMERLSRQR